MDVEQRLDALEGRLRAAEDQLEIIRLLNAYGPMVDSGENRSAAGLWSAGGSYDVSGYHDLSAGQMVAVRDSADMKAMVATGCSHVTATPWIRLDGDAAEAVAYTFVIQRNGDGWGFWRAAINRWRLVRTVDGWRILERINRPRDGSPQSHEVMRTVVA
jgi:hypothetical protein